MTSRRSDDSGGLWTAQSSRQRRRKRGSKRWCRAIDTNASIRRGAPRGCSLSDRRRCSLNDSGWLGYLLAPTNSATAVEIGERRARDVARRRAENFLCRELFWEQCLTMRAYTWSIPAYAASAGNTSGVMQGAPNCHYQTANSAVGRKSKARAHQMGGQIT